MVSNRQATQSKTITSRLTDFVEALSSFIQTHTRLSTSIVDLEKGKKAKSNSCFLAIRFFPVCVYSVPEFQPVKYENA